MITVKCSFYSAFLRPSRWWTWRPPIGQSGHIQRHCHHSAPCKYIHISFFLQPLFPSVFKPQPSITEGLVFTVSKDTSWYFRCWTSSLTTVLSCDQMKWKNLIVTLTVGELFLSVCLCLRGMPCLWVGGGDRGALFEGDKYFRSWLFFVFSIVAAWRKMFVTHSHCVFF